MSERKLSELPVIDEQRIPVGMLDITDVLQCVETAEQSPTASESPVDVNLRTSSAA
jgi:Mg/Co/Ni transporter MgtE